MGRIGYDLEHLDFDGELVGAAFRIPREWDDVVNDVVASSEAVLLRRGAGRRVNKSSVFRHIFHLGYRAFVQDQALKWLARGVPAQRVAAKLRIEDQLLRQWAAEQGLEVDLPPGVYPPLSPAEIEAIRALPEEADAATVQDLLERLV